MKLNKKLLIPVFATAMGLSVIGGISGAVAWYQYNSKVTASFVGASVADSGVLRIKEGASGSWTRAVERKTIDKIRPMTFGYTSENGVPTTNGWMYPEAGAGNGYYEGTDTMAGWVKAEEGKDYAQFDLYFDAIQTDPNSADESGYTPVVREVFFNRIILKNSNSATGKNASDAMRIQLDIDDTTHLILANSEVTTDLFGELDLDASTTADKYHKTLFNELPAGAVDGGTIVYGEDQKQQVAKDIHDYVQQNGDVQIGHGATPLFSTKGSDSEFTHVVVTIWFEGWAKLESTNPRAEWNANNTADYDVQVGLEFSTGIFRGTDLNTL